MKTSHTLFRYTSPMKYGVGLMLVIFVFSGHAQNIPEPKEKFPTFFAASVNGLFPNTFLNSKSLVLKDTLMNSSLTQGFGSSIGGLIRRSYTDRFSLEAGIYYSTRNYQVDISVPDSNIFSSTSLKFTSFELPVNGLVFIKLSEEIYANAALGFSFGYKPSSIGGSNNPSGKHLFLYRGILNSKFSIDANAQFGFELRTRKSGFFYLGGSARVPLAPLFLFVSVYEYKTERYGLAGEANGGYFSLDLRYYFHNVKNKGPQPLKGPIE